MKIAILTTLTIGMVACGGTEGDILANSYAIVSPGETAPEVDPDPGSGPPPAPPVPTSWLSLSPAERGYLARVGVTNAATLGATRTMEVCRVSASQGAVTFNAGTTNTCIWANNVPGWVISETQYRTIRNRNDRGFASVSSVNGPVTISMSEIGSKWSAAIDMAKKAGDFSSETKLKLEYEKIKTKVFEFNGTGNNLIATVTANGGVFEASSIEIQPIVTLLQLQ